MPKRTTVVLGVAALSLALAAALGTAAGAQPPIDHARQGAVTLRHQLGAPSGVPQNFGVIIQTFPSPDVRPAGMGYDGEHLWLVTDGAVNTIWELDPSDGSVIRSIPAAVATFAFGLDHAGSTLWGDTDGPDQIYQSDPADGSVLQSFASPFAQPNGVTWDGLDLWHTGFLEPLTLIDPTDGSTIRTLPAPGNDFPRDTAWDGTRLWVVDANLDEADAVYQIDPADGSVVTGFVPVGDPLGLMYGLAFDGRYLWLSDLFDNQIHKIELAIHVGIWVSGSCPGHVELHLFGDTPNGKVALARGTGTGSFIIPGGPCAGFQFDMSGVSPLRVVTLDGNGELTVGGELGAGACGLFLQALDLTTCDKSVVARVPQQ